MMMQARINQKWFLASLSAVVVAAAALAAHGGRLSPTQTILTGSIEPVIAMASSRSGGRVQEVTAQEGDRVVEGQVLVRFETAELESRRKELISSIGALKTAIENRRAFDHLPANLQTVLGDSHPDVAQAEEAYVRALADFGAAAPQERAAAKIRLDLAAQARVTTRSTVHAAIANTAAQNGPEILAALNARLSEVDNLISDSEVRSPSTGIVDLLKLSPGDRVFPAAPVAAIALRNAYFSELVVGEIPGAGACKAILEDGRLFDCRVEQTSTRTIPPVLRETREKSHEIVTRVVISTSENIPAGAKARFELP